MARLEGAVDASYQPYQDRRTNTLPAADGSLFRLRGDTSQDHTRSPQEGRRSYARFDSPGPRLVRSSPIAWLSMVMRVTIKPTVISGTPWSMQKSSEFAASKHWFQQSKRKAPTKRIVN